MISRARTASLVFSTVLFAGFTGVAACSSSPGAASADPGNGTDPNAPGAPGTPGGTSSSGTTSGGPAAPTCTDGVKNGAESDIDCSGACAKCGVMKACAAAGDCATGLCASGFCVAAGAMNGLRDGEETDVDCGGTAAPPCVTGKTCGAARDCASAVCTAGACAAPSPTDGVKNGTETDVDCGGGAPTCAPNKGCAANTDCKGGKCEAAKCSPTATDGVKNGTETDVDCGGADAPKCVDTKACAVNTDCTNGVCSALVCTPPSKTDGVKNGTETDIDCGGGAPTNAPACGTNKTCAADADCDNGSCGAVGTALAGKCLAGRSCSGGVGAGNNCGLADNENCCQTLPIPGGTFRRSLDNSLTTIASFNLDKYEVTQGRFRQFLKAMNGNPNANFPTWLAAHPGAGTHPKVAASGWRSTFNVRLPRNWAEINARFTLGCSDGGNNADGGAATWTDNDLHTLTTNDEKSMTCADWYSLYAFCAWDGGFLPTDAQWNYAAAGGDEQRQYAWKANGDATKPDYFDVPAGQDPNVYVLNGFKIGDWTVHAMCLNGGWPGCFSVGTSYRVAADGPAHVSAPGKKKDIGRWGHADFGGNLIEWLLDEKYPGGTCNDCADVSWPNPPQGAEQLGRNPSQWREVGHEFDGRFHADGGRVMRGGSWERHDYVQGPRVRSIYNEYPVFRTYYAVGARCARPKLN